MDIKKIKICIFFNYISNFCKKKYYEFISSLPQDKIIIFVTHRLSSIKYSNIVIFLNKGQIIDDDNHHNLFKNNREYRTFYKSQADNYFTTTINKQIN